MHQCLWVALAACLLTAADGPKTDRDRIQGGWALVERETNGQADPPDAIKKREATMFFEADRVRVQMGTMSADLGTFALDPEKTPKHFNRVYPDGSPRLGIYELTDDRLRICVAGLGKERPDAFATKAGEGTALLTYKRAGASESP